MASPGDKQEVIAGAAGVNRGIKPLPRLTKLISKCWFVNETASLLEEEEKGRGVSEDKPEKDHDGRLATAHLTYPASCAAVFLPVNATPDGAVPPSDPSLTGPTYSSVTSLSPSSSSSSFTLASVKLKERHQLRVRDLPTGARSILVWKKTTRRSLDKHQQQKGKDLEGEEQEEDEEKKGPVECVLLLRGLNKFVDVDEVGLGWLSDVVADEFSSQQGVAIADTGHRPIQQQRQVSSSASSHLSGFTDVDIPYTIASVSVQRKLGGFIVGLFSLNGTSVEVMTKHSLDGVHVTWARKILESMMRTHDSSNNNNNKSDDEGTAATLRRLAAFLARHQLIIMCECVDLEHDNTHPMEEAVEFDKKLVAFALQRRSTICEQAVPSAVAERILQNEFGIPFVPQKIAATSAAVDAENEGHYDDDDDDATNVSHPPSSSLLNRHDSTIKKMMKNRKGKGEGEGREDIILDAISQCNDWATAHEGFVVVIEMKQLHTHATNNNKNNHTDELSFIRPLRIKLKTLKYKCARLIRSYLQGEMAPHTTALEAQPAMFQGFVAWYLREYILPPREARKGEKELREDDQSKNGGETWRDIFRAFCHQGLLSSMGCQTNDEEESDDASTVQRQSDWSGSKRYTRVFESLIAAARTQLMPPLSVLEQKERRGDKVILKEEEEEEKRSSGRQNRNQQQEVGGMDTTSSGEKKKDRSRKKSREANDDDDYDNDTRDQNNSPPPPLTVIIMCGIPGSGKSTTSRALKKVLERNEAGRQKSERDNKNEKEGFCDREEGTLTKRRRKEEKEGAGLSPQRGQCNDNAVQVQAQVVNRISASNPRSGGAFVCAEEQKEKEEWAPQVNDDDDVVYKKEGEKQKREKQPKRVLYNVETIERDVLVSRAHNEEEAFGRSANRTVRFAQRKAHKRLEQLVRARSMTLLAEAAVNAVGKDEERKETKLEAKTLEEEEEDPSVKESACSVIKRSVLIIDACNATKASRAHWRSLLPTGPQVQVVTVFLSVPTQVAAMRAMTREGHLTLDNSDASTVTNAIHKISKVLEVDQQQKQPIPSNNNNNNNNNNRSDSHDHQKEEKENILRIDGAPSVKHAVKRILRCVGLITELGKTATAAEATNHNDGDQSSSVHTNELKCYREDLPCCWPRAADDDDSVSPTSAAHNKNQNKQEKAQLKRKAEGKESAEDKFEALRRDFDVSLVCLGGGDSDDGGIGFDYSFYENGHGDGSLSSSVRQQEEKNTVDNNRTSNSKRKRPLVCLAGGFDREVVNSIQSKVLKVLSDLAFSNSAAPDTQRRHDEREDNNTNNTKSCSSSDACLSGCDMVVVTAGHTRWLRALFDPKRGKGGGGEHSQQQQQQQSRSKNNNDIASEPLFRPTSTATADSLHRKMHLMPAESAHCTLVYAHPPQTPPLSSTPTNSSSPTTGGSSSVTQENGTQCDDGYYYELTAPLSMPSRTRRVQQALLGHALYRSGEENRQHTTDGDDDVNNEGKSEGDAVSLQVSRRGAGRGLRSAFDEYLVENGLKKPTNRVVKNNNNNAHTAEDDGEKQSQSSSSCSRDYLYRLVIDAVVADQQCITLRVAEVRHSEVPRPRPHTNGPRPRHTNTNTNGVDEGTNDVDEGGDDDDKEGEGEEERANCQMGQLDTFFFKQQKNNDDHHHICDDAVDIEKQKEKEKPHAVEPVETFPPITTGVTIHGAWCGTHHHTRVSGGPPHSSSSSPLQVILEHNPLHLTIALREGADPFYAAELCEMANREEQNKQKQKPIAKAKEQHDEHEREGVVAGNTPRRHNFVCLKLKVPIEIVGKVSVRR